VDDRDVRIAVFWHHGRPNIGASPAPPFAAADWLGIRWVSYDRPADEGTLLGDDAVARAARDDEELLRTGRIQSERQVFELAREHSLNGHHSEWEE
jgi:hypothetical protein